MSRGLELEIFTNKAARLATMNDEVHLALHLAIDKDRQRAWVRAFFGEPAIHKTQTEFPAQRVRIVRVEIDPHTPRVGKLPISHDENLGAKIWKTAI